MKQMAWSCSSKIFTCFHFWIIQFDDEETNLRIKMARYLRSKGSTRKIMGSGSWQLRIRCIYGDLGRISKNLSHRKSQPQNPWKTTNSRTDWQNSETNEVQIGNLERWYCIIRKVFISLNSDLIHQEMPQLGIDSLRGPWSFKWPVPKRWFTLSICSWITSIQFRLLDIIVNQFGDWYVDKVKSFFCILTRFRFSVDLLGQWHHTYLFHTVTDEGKKGTLLRNSR